MTFDRSHLNPFDLVKASDFSDEQIEKYWVDLAGEARLEDLFQPRLRMPMLLLGGKGSGKTHLMRYYSSAVRKANFGGSLLKASTSDKYLGIYVRADGLNVGRFDGKGKSEEAWGAVFSYYFELWLATHFLRNVEDCLSDASLEFDEPAFIRDAKELFNTAPTLPAETLKGFIAYLVETRKSIDHVVRNVDTGRSKLDQIDICLSPGNLVFDLPECLNKHTSIFGEVLFVYMIDEIENFTSTQQKFLNSLIRYRRGPVSLKIGARLYGIRTKKTLLGAQEEIRQGAEYQKVELDAWLRDHDEGYRNLSKKLVVKRLIYGEFLPEGTSETYDLSSYFENLDGTDHYQQVTLGLVKKFDEKNEDRPYFKQLRNHLHRWGGFADDEFAASLSDEIISTLKVPEYPLFEKVNVYLLYKNWSANSGMVEQANKIALNAKNFMSKGKTGSHRYYQTLSHFKSDFLAQLYRECGKGNVVYAGLETLIHLSQGIPRNLLGLLNYIYRRSQFANEKPFQEGAHISLTSQVEGIKDAAVWFWDDAQPDSHGPEVRQAVQNLAEFFSKVRFSLKPAECDLSTFTLDANDGNEVARDVLKHAENWSYLVRISAGGSDRNDAAAVDEKYQLSPMLAPRWGVSEHRRGTISLRSDLFNAIFDPSLRTKLDKLAQDRLRGMEEPFRKIDNTDENQEPLF